MSRTAQEIVNAEVYCCMSSMVSMLASAYDDCANKDLNSLCEQAGDLAAPIDNWEEAALENGWRIYKGEYYKPGIRLSTSKLASMGGGTAQQVCEFENLAPLQREVFEHWAISDWFADKLIAAGEKVDKDFAGLCVWARTTTGQAIYADSVTERIAADIAR